MRKKSHISLASYLMESMNTEELRNHKKAFYIGSILPDCVPSFVTRRHNIEETFDLLKEEIIKITDDYDMNKGITGYYCRHLGVITHYIADYFTFPHTKLFTGTMREHCSYEKELKFALKSYVNSEAVQQIYDRKERFKTVDEICNFIKEMHAEYLKAMKAIKMDCMYIVKLCQRVVEAILMIFKISFASNNLVQAI
ncbi:hypothetical protein GCM10023142_32340 [Anaerocolumna aminovalerica]|jgi:hypothetical protein|uniref:Zinc dependent phospholipase C n=1 Tax=Anaerocolumna aminovalerica TaxID=1527 RepID=A0A1I5GEL8_9FIRM|nr:zinc dependent phospholipase C family protein [Anaerocolumna aminovalerica]MBU5331950.1 zinc dependent phospholipase C family protein [Anaerocolumna aminovalerica]MDU6264544.1 zinc dependent phospholipase C family protein [Anaerocolumna aminovalerica]SFO34505.1 Zinc dependent phospholipase C [Anaerocolumna aminovalerica]